MPARLTRAALACATLAGFGAIVTACGLSQDVGSAVTAPLAVLPATDVVVETNLQSASNAAAGSLGGVQVVSGPSTNYNTISEASNLGTTVLVGFNQLSNDCLGLIRISSPSSPVLGESQIGTYDFWVTGTTPAVCDAATFAATAAVPHGWPAADPGGTWPTP